MTKSRNIGKGRNPSAPATFEVKDGVRIIRTPAGRLVRCPDDPRTAVAKETLIECIVHGYNVKQSLEAIGRQRVTYEKWRREDPEFKAQCDALKRHHGTLRDMERVKVEARQSKARAMEYAEFSREYLGQRVFPHTQNVIDLIEGRDPRWLHPSMTYEPGESDLIIVNMPPEHAKTTAITVNYVVHQIVKDPSIRVMIVSKSQVMARKMLLAVKSRLTSPQYRKLVAEFAPPGGFDADAAAWTADMIYVGGNDRDAEQKDPTVQALGIRGHIYGARADLIVLDDTVDLTNANDFERQIEWIQSEVISRLSSNGKLLVVGTRLAPRDLYMELLDPARYSDERPPWTYLAMPAVLEFADDPVDWVTLWPRSDRAERGDMVAPDADGLYPKWDGPRLFKKRRRMGSGGTWSRVYQQQQTNEDTVFHPEDIAGCTTTARLMGPLPKRDFIRDGTAMEGLVVVAGLDPATTGNTAMVVVGLDVRAQKRWVLDVRNLPGLKPDAMREMIYRLTDMYSITEWVIETNGFQGFLAHDRELNSYLSGRGCLIRPHFTGNVKHDPDFGVAAMAGLFSGWREGHNLIDLPSTVNAEGVKALVEQLATWAPKMGKRQKTDTVMALWMAELACIRRIDAHRVYGRTHNRSPFHTRWDIRSQRTFDLTEMAMAGRG